MLKKLATGLAATLSVVALAAGPVSAQPAPANAGVAQHRNVVISEVFVHSDPDSSFIELESFQAQGHDLDGFELRGCDATDAFLIVDFGTSDVIDPVISSFYLIAGPNYPGDADRRSSIPLNQDDGGVFLLDTSTSPAQVVNGVRWGDPNCPGLTPAPGNPTDLQSLHFDPISGNWDLDDPSPGS